MKNVWKGEIKFEKKRLYKLIIPKSNILSTYFQIDIDIKNRDVSSSSNLEDVQSIESRDYHVYGDAPPSYNKSKYFPKADISSGSEHIYTNPSSSLISMGNNDNKNNSSRSKKSSLVSQLKTNTNKQITGTNLGEIESHIYENIEEIVSKGNANNNNNNNRKGKFQALKNKHSHRSNNQTNNIQIDAAASSHESINSSVRQLSSPITNTADWELDFKYCVVFFLFSVCFFFL